MILQILLQQSSYRNNGLISCVIVSDDSIGCSLGMDDLATAHVDCHMTCITDQVTCLCIRIADFLTAASLGTGKTWDADSEVCIDIAGKSTTVCTGIRVFSTPDIWFSDKLHGIVHDIRTADIRSLWWI